MEQKVTVEPFIAGIAMGYIVRAERCILVDAGNDTHSDAAELLQRAGVSPGEVSLIVLTHNHPDHTAALTNLRELTGAPLLCHARAAESLASGSSEPVVPRTLFARLAVRAMGNRPADPSRATRADIVIDSETNLEPYGVPGTIVPTPGHTAGSLSVVLESGEAIIGDLVMKFGPGRPRLSFLSNSEDELLASLRTLLERGVHTFYLSHGGAVPRSAVERLVR